MSSFDKVILEAANTYEINPEEFKTFVEKEFPRMVKDVVNDFLESKGEISDL